MNSDISLFEASAEIKEIESVLSENGGDLSVVKNGRSIEELLNDYQIVTQKKIDGICWLISKWEDEADSCKRHAVELNSKAKIKLNRVERLKQLIMDAMVVRGIVKVDGVEHSVWWQKNGGNPSVVIEKTLEEMPSQYRKTIPAHEEIDTEKLKADAIAGNEEALKLCKVGEIGTSLRIK